MPSAADDQQILGVSLSAKISNIDLMAFVLAYTSNVLTESGNDLLNSFGFNCNWSDRQWSGHWPCVAIERHRTDINCKGGHNLLAKCVCAWRSIDWLCHQTTRSFWPFPYILSISNSSPSSESFMTDNHNKITIRPQAYSQVLHQRAVSIILILRYLYCEFSQVKAPSWSGDVSHCLVSLSN